MVSLSWARKKIMANPDCTPFLYGATAYFSHKKKGRSDIVIIEINQHPIIYSRAICAVRPGEKSARNNDYLSTTWRACEERCPLQNHSPLNVICKRSTSVRAIANTEDSSELDINQWSDVLRSGLCRPVLY